MSENVKIAEIDIGVDKLTDKAGKARKEMLGLQKANRDLKKETDNLQNATKEQLNQFTQNEVAIKKYRKEVNDSQKVLDAYINIQNKDIKTKQQARDANRKLIAIANELDTTNEDQAKTLKLINQRIDDNTKFIKDNASEYEKTKIGIGDYKNQIKAAYQEMGIFGQNQQAVNNVTSAGGTIISFVSTNLKQVKDDYKKAAAATTGMSKAQIAAHLTSTTLASGLRILKIALAATGIGAIVVVLGSLITYLATTQEGINKVNMVLTPLKEAFNAVKGSVQELGAAFAKLFTGDIQGFLGDIKQIGSEMGNSIKEAIERGKEMERIQQNLNKTEADYITLQAKLKREFEEQKKLSDDTTKSTEVREKAAEKAIALQEEISKGAIRRIEQEAEILRLKQQSNDTSDAERAELATKLAEIDKALEEEAAKTTEAQNKLNAIRKEANAREAAEAKALADQRIQAAQKATEAAISESKTRLQIFIEENKGKADTLQESVEVEEQVRDRKIGILKEELEAKKLTQLEYELAILQTKNEFLDQQAQLTEQYAQKEIEAEQERLAKRQELEAQEKERKATDLQNKREIEQENFFAQLELEKQQLEVKRQQELEAAEQTGADKALINQKYAEVEKDIEAEKQRFKQDIASQTFGNMAEILGKETAAGKAAAIAQTTIDTYQAATAAYKAMSGIPVVGPALGAVAATAAVVSGLQSVKKITSTQEPNIPRAEQGAVLDINGRSHSHGGETFYDGSGNPIVEAQGGEKMVILKREASKELDILSRLNMKHGGVSLSQPVSYAANGGAIIRNPASPVKTSQINYGKMALMIGSQVGAYVSENINSVQTVVPVDQVTNMAAKTARVERAANL